MHAIINNRTIELVQGDIARQEVDAIVNAANSRLAGGGGVDGAIHRAGGPAIMEETNRRYPDGCPTGSAVISGAGELPAKFVIHAVGPVWRGGEHGEELLLTGAFRAALELATKHECQNVALPALSTGAYRYPIAAAARVAIATAAEFLGQLRDDQTLQTVRFVLFSSEALAAFEQALSNWKYTPEDSNL